MEHLHSGFALVLLDQSANFTLQQNDTYLLHVAYTSAAYT